MQMAEGYPAEAQFVRKVENGRNLLRQWPYSRQLFLSHGGRGGAPVTGQIFRQPDLFETLRKLVEAETRALESGMDRKAAILAAQERFYQGDIAAEFVRGSREQGGLHTLEDLAVWRVKLEEPVQTTYKGIEVYKLTTWTQGPVLLQMLNLLEPLDLQAMGYNSARYIHTLYQVMNLAFADRDFYYGDPSFPPDEPIRGLLSRDYADQRRGQINRERNDRRVKPGDPYPFQDSTNPHLELLEQWGRDRRANRVEGTRDSEARARAHAAFLAGTTSIQAADADGWAVSITPSGGWLPVCIAGRTGIGMSQRMQSFALDEKENPFNVVAPGKRPRVTLTPTLALKEGRPFLCFSVQGGDTQDQNLLQFFLNMVEFGMTVQEASEAANITNHQMYSSFGDHESEPGLLTLTDEVPSWVRRELERMGYRLEFKPRNSGPITAIYFDQERGTLQGGVSDDGEDHGIAW
jgi:gamma-glutamyltranspeptidase/glutathione hydrolase